MAPEAVDRADPIEEIVTRMLGPKTSGVTILPGLHIEKKALAAVDTAGGIFSWQNPLDQKVMATIIIEVTTAASAACTIDVGRAGDATTSADNLIDGLDVNAAAGEFNAIDNKGTNGRAWRKVDEKGGTTDFITGSKATGASAGLVGNAYILYFPIA
jgi:hypothetical protein